MASIKYTNNAKTTLAADLNNSATSATVVNGNLFPSLSSGEHFYCTFDDGTNTEIVKVTARSTHVLTIVRAQDNTSARAFSSGDKAELRITAVVLEEVSTSTSSWNTDIFAGDGSDTTFTLTQAATDEKYLQVYIDGAFQAHNTYSVSGTTLTFATAPANSRVITVYHIEPVALGTADTITATANNSANETVFPVFVDGATGTQGLETDTGFTYNPSSGVLTIAGELDAATLDISGNGDVAGTLAVSGGSSNGVLLSQGAISIKNGGAKSYIDLYCESSNAHYTRIEAAAHGAYSGNVTATLPVTTGTLALTSDIHTTEELQDIIGAMFASNTETGITVTYQDGDGTIDLVVGTLNQNTTGSAATLTTARAIAVAGDVTGTANFDGSAGISITTTLATDAIVTANITNANVTVEKMAANSVDSDQYVDGSIDTAHIADSQITSAKIADGTIATGDIADDAVTGDKLSNDVTIANDLTVSGDLVVTGSTTQTGSLLSNSNFQALSQNNSGNSTDFGFYGKYVESSTTKYAGLAFDASTDNTFRLFVDTTAAPGSTVNTGATGYAAGTLIAGEVSMTTLDIGGTNVTSTAAELNILDGVTSTAAELNALDGITAVVGELNALDIGSTAVGTAVASKAVILDSNKDYTGIRNFTISGELDAATLDVSGNVDIDGVLETDNLTVGGAQGTDGQVLTSTGSGVAWEDAAGGGVAGITSSANATAIAISSAENSTFSGHIYANANNTYDLGATATRWRNIYTNDLQLSNEGGDANEVDGTHGSWTIQEGNEDLFIINRKSGKKYKFKLEEM